MALLHTLPTADGFTMPAEFAPHSATVLIWPVRPGSWGRDPSAAQCAFLDVIRRDQPRARMSICLPAPKMRPPPAQLWRTSPA